LAVLGDRSLPLKARRNALIDLHLYYGTDASIDVLRSVAREAPQQGLRIGAIGALADIGSKAAIDELIASLSYGDSLCVRRAAIALELRTEHRAIPQLLRCLVDRGEDLNSDARCRILAALYVLPAPSSLDALVPFLTHRDRKTRRAAANAVGAIGDAESLTALETAVAELGFRRGPWASIWVDRLRDAAPSPAARSLTDDRSEAKQLSPTTSRT
jgi:HEAT repeat protein